MSAAQRSALYAVVVAVVPLCVAYGVISKEDAPLWLALASASLSAVVAFFHRPTKKA